MDKAEIQTNQVDGKDRPLKGLQNRGLVNFECADCGKLLLILQLVSIANNDQSEVLTRVAVLCGLCGGCSYVQQITGQFYPGAPNDHMRFDVSDFEDMLKNPVPQTDVLFKAWSK